MFGYKMLFMFLLSLYILNLKAILSLDRHDKEFGAVILTNVIFRHGDRTPTKSYPNDPYQNFSWPGGYGQLTKLGKNQMYDLGKWLRSRYDHLLSEQYSKQEIYVTSTDADRTLMSVSCTLAGLYPVREELKWNAEINWDPIPIHGLPLDSDKLIGVTAYCPNFLQELKRVMRTDEIQEILDKYKTVLDNILKYTTGDEAKWFFEVNRLYDTLTIQKNHNLSLPEWTATVYPDLLKEVTLFTYRFPTWNLPMQRIKAGPLLGKLVSSFRAKQQGTLEPNRTVLIYSGHDSTIGNILNSLKLFNFEIPPLASALLFELRQNVSDHFVTIFYRNTSYEEPHLLVLPGCDAACPLSDFITLTQPLIPTNWDGECQDTGNSTSLNC